MSSPQAILSKLTALPHRGSTTSGEAEAADIISEWLDSCGLDPRKQSFQSVSTYSWEVINMAVFFALGVGLGPFYPIPGTMLVVFGLWSFWRHFTVHKTMVSHLLRKHPSQNVIGRIPARKEEHCKVILMAHYDTARAGLLWAPSMVNNFRASFKLNATLAFVLVPWTWLGTEWGNSLWFQVSSLVFALYFLVQVGIFIHREFWHQYVNGANDNASGVTTILSLAAQYANKPFDHTGIMVVATGCEEVGAIGASAFLENHENELDRETTYILNFDNVGAATLHYAVGEGMLSFWTYDAELVRTANALAREPEFINVKPCRFRLAYFDTLPAVQDGYKCMTFIGLRKDMSIPNWH